MSRWPTVCLIAALAVACSPVGSKKGHSTLTIAVRADIRGIYPRFGNESFSSGVNSNWFEGLTRLDGNLRPQPAVADSWESPDAQTWVFHLRRNLHFSDGTPVRAHDVVASVLFASNRQPAPDYFLNKQSVEAVSDHDIRILTRHPTPLLLTQLAPLFILPASAFSDGGNSSVGTGPYAIKEWTPGKELILETNRFYWGSPPAYDEVRFKVLPDSRDRIQALLDGQAQVAEHVAAEDVDRVRRTPHVRIVSRPGLTVLFLCFRMTELPFSNPLVREAVDLAIDRDALIERALAGQGTPASQLVPAAVVGYNPGLQVSRPDKARARSLLARAGYPNGFAVTLDGPNNRYRNDGEILKDVALQLGDVGIRVEVRAQPKDRFFALQEASGSRFYLLGWSCTTLNAGEVLDALAHTSRGGRGSENSQFLSDGPLDRLIEEADDSPDLPTKIALFKKALARVAELRPILPLVIQREVFGLSDTVDWDPPLDTTLQFHDFKPSSRPKE